jgi:hypothetical protein
MVLAIVKLWDPLLKPICESFIFQKEKKKNEMHRLIVQFSTALKNKKEKRNVDTHP